MKSVFNDRKRVVCSSSVQMSNDLLVSIVHSFNMLLKTSTVSAVKRTQLAWEKISNSVGCEIGNKYVVNENEVPSEIAVVLCLVSA